MFPVSKTLLCISAVLLGSISMTPEVNGVVVLPPAPPASWMQRIADTTPLYTLVIPGTHDSCAYDVQNQAFSGRVISQTSSLTQQLERGIRYFDMRVGVCEGVPNRLCMFHGPYYLNKNFDSVMTDLKGYLKAHPSEAVMMRLQVEKGDGIGDFQTFFETNHIDQDQSVWYQGDRLEGNGKPATGVLMGDVRGKIVLFWSSGRKTSRYGYDYDVIDQRKDYVFPTRDEIVRRFNERAGWSWHADIPGWYENPTSGIINPFGKEVSTFSIDTIADFVQPRVLDSIRANRMKKGIVSMDFPRDEVIQELIKASVPLFPFP